MDARTLTIAVPAAADLSTLQYHAVKLNSSGEAAICTTIVDIAIGILQNKPDTAGLPALVAVEGASNIKLGGTLAIGALIGINGDAEGIADAATNFTLGVLLKGGVDGGEGEVLLNRMTVK